MGITSVKHCCVYMCECVSVCARTRMHVPFLCWTRLIQFFKLATLQFNMITAFTDSHNPLRFSDMTEDGHTTWVVYE